MSAKTDAASAELARLKRIYQQGLKTVDGMLAQAVTQNSSDLSTARAMQRSYGYISYERIVPSLDMPCTQFEIPQLTDGPVLAVLA